MKKVLVFGMTENPGGVESIIMNYYRHMDRNRVQFDFLCNSKSIAYEEEIRNMGGNVYKIISRRENYWRFKKELREFMKIHAKEYAALWVNLCSLVNIDYLIMAKKYGIVKRIIHCHNSDNDAGFLKGMIHRINKCTVGFFATDFWSCSESASPWFFGTRIMKSAAYKVIPNAIDVEKYEKNEAIRKKYRKELLLEGKLVIGHVGRFHFQKNHEFLINVFETMAKKSPKYHLLLVGQGDLETEIKQMVREKDLEDRVTFCGARTDVENLYQAMDMLMFPSKFEGLGVVVLEAQANGLPCLLASTIPEIVKVNDNVRFLPLDASLEYWGECAEKMLLSPNTVENKLKSSEYNIKVQKSNFEKCIV